MKDNGREAALRVAAALEDDPGRLSRHTVTLGVDAFIDIITRPIAQGNALQPEKLFDSSDAFASYLMERSGRSCCIELQERVRKLGGNMPICAAALGSLGITANCVGPLGWPEVLPLFHSMPDTCRFYSAGSPGECVALEFGDNKVMLALNNGINRLNWEQIKQRVGEDTLLRLCRDSGAICLLNWGEVPGATEIFQGFLEEIFPHLEHRPTVLFDFSDCARRTAAQLRELAELVRSVSDRLCFPVTVSLNENEAAQLEHALECGGSTDGEERAQALRLTLHAQRVVLHFAEAAYGADPQTSCRFSTRHVESPAITTGAGDHFNAGLCAAQLLELSLDASLALASMLSSYYVKYGKSPTPSELAVFIHSHPDEGPIF